MAEKKTKKVTKKKAEKKTKTAQKKTAAKARPAPKQEKPTKRKKAPLKPAVKKTIKKKKAGTARKSGTVTKSSGAGKPSQKRTEEERKAALRRSLITRREQIVKEAKEEISKYIKGETRQLVDTALDDGDWSVVDLSEDVSLRQLSTHKENLRKIDEALRKVDEGTYGICEDCGEEISAERLRIMPFAIYCTDCQERRELLEEIERREG